MQGEVVDMLRGEVAQERISGEHRTRILLCTCLDQIKNSDDGVMCAATTYRLDSILRDI